MSPETETVDQTQRFYDALASDYDLIFADWQASVRRQAEILDRIIRGHLAAWPLAVLDCTCGIGTQAIGLALRGYRVHATDLSAAAVERAQREAAAAGATLKFGIADVRSLAEQVSGHFDVVLSCDNALPHLLSDGELRLALRNLWSKLAPGGLLLVRSGTMTRSSNRSRRPNRRGYSTGRRAGVSSSRSGTGSQRRPCTSCTTSSCARRGPTGGRPIIRCAIARSAAPS